MFPIRVKTVQESDLRMLGSLARNIQRVLPVTQADIDAAAALGKGWVVWKVFEVSGPLDNLRGGTQLIIRQNSVQPGQNVRRVIFVSGPGGQTVVIRGTDYIVLPDAIANSLSYVKAFGGTEQSNLPSGYTQFDRIHFDGHCYFNTGVVINSLTATVKLIAAFDSQTDTSPCVIWGYMGGNANLPRWGVGLYTGKWLTSPNGTLPYGTTDTDKHIFITELYDNSGTPYWRTYVDGALLGGAAIVNPETITGNTISTYIGARNNNGTAGNYVKGNFTYLEITQDGVCLAKIYPCKRDSDNVLGLYNTVTNEFLPNLGTGTLTADIFASPTPDVPMDIVSNNGVLEFQDSELPSEYRRVLGYACDNDVLWQITDFHLRGSDTIRISFSVTAACNVFGCYQGTDATDNYDLYVSATSGSRYLRYGDGTYLSYWSSANMGQRFDVVFTPTGTSGMPQDSTWAPMTFESANNLLLAATTLTGTSSKLRGNLYGSFVVDGRLKLIPCERVSDGVLGYYDTYTGTFYEPTGTPTSLGYDFSYYSIKTSGTVETIGIKDSNNLLPANAEPDVLYPINVPNAGTYTFSAKVNGGQNLSAVQGKFYNADKQQINYYTLNTFSDSRMHRSFSLTTATKYVSISRTSAYATTPVTELKVEKGGSMTPYYNGGTATAEMLLKVGDYQDVQSIIDGVVTRNVGVKVLDGTETIAYFSSSNRIAVTIPDILAQNVPVLCNQFKTGNTGDYYVNAAAANSYLYLYNKDCNSQADYVSFLATQYAAGTPVIVLYPLAEPTTESVTGQTLQVQDGDNTLEITQAGMDWLELEAQYNAAVSLTIQEVQDANLDNNVTVTIQ
jgi:hypothetical protein